MKLALAIRDPPEREEMPVAGKHDERIYMETLLWFSSKRKRGVIL